MDNAPTITITEADFGKKLLDILVDNKVFESKGAGRRLIAQMVCPSAMTNGLT